MDKDIKKKEEKPKKSEFKAFLKKRAPIYLGIIGILVIFVIPELTKSDLQSSFPDNLTDDQKQIVDPQFVFDHLLNYLENYFVNHFLLILELQKLLVFLLCLDK